MEANEGLVYRPPTTQPMSRAQKALTMAAFYEQNKEVATAFIMAGGIMGFIVGLLLGLML